MNLKFLLDKYAESPRILEIADRIVLSSPQKIVVNGVSGSLKSFIFSALYHLPALSGYNHLFILEDAEEAAYLHNDIEQLISPIDLFYFPSSFKTNKNFRLQSSSHVMLRTEALTRLASPGNKKIIVTYPEALMEKVASAKVLSTNMISLKVNDKLDTHDLMERLVGYGFERTDFVYEPGQFAMRGGIFDIYSFGNEKPYRLELFGQEIDSIRIFDPESQLSERKLLQVNIIPNADAHYTAAEKVDFLELLPPNTIVYTSNWQLIIDRFRDYEDNLNLFFGQLDQEKELEAQDEKQVDLQLTDFSSADQFEQGLDQKTVVELAPAASMASYTLQVDFQSSPQPSFNRQFELLIKDLKSHEVNKKQLYIFSENPKQLERLYSIFADLKSEIQFVPVPAAIHQGFIDKEQGVVAYTDHQIFQRYHKYKIKQAYNKSKAITLRALKELQPGDFVVHIDHGVGVFSGLQKVQNGGQTPEAVRIIYRDNDILYVNINSLHKISKYTGKEGHVPKVNKLGSDVWVKLKEKTKGRVKEIAFDLIKLYAERKA
ncbi:MAG: transcription-repair coupling factor, partial [Bacteroidota bacterium]